MSGHEVADEIKTKEKIFNEKPPRGSVFSKKKLWRLDVSGTTHLPFLSVGVSVNKSCTQGVETGCI